METPQDVDLFKFHFDAKNINRYRKCLDHGHVTLVDAMPRVVQMDAPTLDYAVLTAARNSYITNREKVHTVAENRGLIRYLMRHNHTTPFEMVALKFDIKLPIFVARQLVRHRTASLNEVSARYSKLPGEFYMPTDAGVRQQSKTNKQGSDGSVDASVASRFIDFLKRQSDGYNEYEQFIEEGVGLEMARMGLPLNIYTQWTWKIDLHNLLRLLGLRCDKHAQWEIRTYADAMLDLIRPLAPWTIEAWEDFSPFRKAVTLTGPEVEALSRSGLKLDSIPELDERTTTREQNEWADKLKAMSLLQS